MKKFYAVFLLLFAIAFAKAQTITQITWKSSVSSGNWSTTSNWDLGRVPQSGDSVVFNSNATVTMDQTVGSTTSFYALTINGGGTLQIALGTTNTKDSLVFNLGTGGSANGASVFNILSGKSLTLQVTTTGSSNTSAQNNSGHTFVIPSGYTANIWGTLNLGQTTAGSASNGIGLNQMHILKAVDANSVTFYSGSLIALNKAVSGALFPFGSANSTSTNSNIVVFNSGSTFALYQGPSAAPFGSTAPPANPIAKFSNGSTCVFYGGLNAPIVNGRTYGTLVFNGVAPTTQPNNGNTYTTYIDSLKVLSGNITLSSSGNISSPVSGGPNFQIGYIGVGTSGGSTPTLTLANSATSTSSNAANFYITGDIVVGGGTGASQTLVLGETIIPSKTQKGTTITFAGSGKSLTVTGNGVLKQADTTGGLTTNYIIDSTANFTLNKDLTMATANTTSSLTVRPKGILNIGSSATLTTNGNVTIESDSTGTGSLGNSAGNISGTVTVQRYIPSLNRKKYVLVSSPVTSTINAGWQEGQTGSTFTTTANYGTQITAGVSQGTNGFDGPSTSTQSIWTYDDTKTAGTKWTAVSSTTASNSLAPGVGYLLFVRGDRAEDRATSGNSSNTTLRATGAIQTGNFAPTLNTTTNSLYNLVANPYPCAINWGGITASNLSGSFTVYDPNLQSFVTSDGTTVSPNTSQQQANVIQSGQAFFIQNAATGTPSIQFTESAKTTSAGTASSQTVFGAGTNKSQLNMNVYRAADKSLADGVVALFGEGYSKAVSLQEDASKFTNFNETFSLSRDNQSLSIEKRPVVSGGSDTLYLAMKNFGKKDYVLQIDGNNWGSDVSGVLIDNYTQSREAIDPNVINHYPFTVPADAASSNSNRFIVVLNSKKQISAVDLPDNNISVKASPNPVLNELTVTSKNTMHTIRLLSVNGVAGITQTNINNTIAKLNVSSMSSGVYVLEVTDINGKVNVQKIVKQ